ncbi:hypothetical protein [Sanguibacter sp. 25GB23B1]|uniref:hypothetical protein n=1 Tax=unclassified Sanguibacter TaxID=2645534 RepID=UPI0032AF89A2
MGAPGDPLVDDVVAWLLDGDVAVQYQTRRDLLDDDRPDLRSRVADQGDAATILAAHTSGGWGDGFYAPKWTCTHYALLELRDLGVPADHPACTRAVASALEEHLCTDGGINPADSVKVSDVCMNGMFLAYACFFGADAPSVDSVVDFVLQEEMPGGGFNCRSNRSGARVASVHSTTSVIDGLAEYLRSGRRYRAEEARRAIDSATEVLLDRRLYQRRSDGAPIRAELTRLHHPPRWHFDVLRGLDVLRSAGTAYDPRLEDALDIVRSRRRADGRWTGSAQYPGRTHVAYPRAGQPDRWVTLRALRTLRSFGTVSATAGQDTAGDPDAG